MSHAEPSNIQTAWQTLLQGGVPVGAPRRRTELPSPGELAQAVEVVAASAARSRDSRAEALYAFLMAWSSHWPDSFARELGRGQEHLRNLLPARIDLNRYLKLRRIAVANLSRLL